MSTKRLMQRFRTGDADAVRTLYDEFGKAVFVVALRALGDRDLAEEAVQLTFLKAWRAADRFDVGRDPGPWLYAIARRVAVDLYRRERRHASVDDDTAEVAVMPKSFENTWEAWEVRNAVDRLSAEERDVVRAAHFAGMSHAQIADRLGVPIGTVKSRSNRAHRRLAEMLHHLREEATA